VGYHHCADQLTGLNGSKLAIADCTPAASPSFP
jgi:hypothetical protein